MESYRDENDNFIITSNLDDLIDQERGPFSGEMENLVPIPNDNQIQKKLANAPQGSRPDSPTDSLSFETITLGGSLGILSDSD